MVLDLFPFNSCDPGFGGSFCVPTKPLPMTLKNTFDEKTWINDWWKIIGAQVSNGCGSVGFGKALVFDGVAYTNQACLKYYYVY